MSFDRHFREEILEICVDLRRESQYVHTFYDDPELRAAVQQMVRSTFRTTLQATRRGLIDDDVAYRAGLLLLTYGFYLGREHARRGYSSPVPVHDGGDGAIPNTPADLERW